MMAAGRAAERGKRVLLLEKNRTLGRKLGITGGGRCNIANAEENVRELLSFYGDAEPFLYSPFSQFGMKDTFTFFESRGLPLVVEAKKRAFPATQDALDVVRVMKEYVMAHNVTIRTGVRVDGFIQDAGKIIGVKTNGGVFAGRTFMLATGGNSRPETGSTGEGISWLSTLGHTVHNSNPDIVPLIALEDWVKKLSGTSLSFMKITFSDMEENKETRFSRTGKILFTHFGVSGPLILNSAKEVKKLLAAGPVRAYIDLYPDTEVGTVRNRVLGVFEQNKNKDFKNILKGLVPAGMTEAVLSLLPAQVAEKKVHSITKEERLFLSDLLKAMPLTISGTMGYEWAVVSDGGVDLAEIDTKTMRSKKHGNLFVIGDALHVSRPSGGYSLQLCWTTGYVAGSAV